MKQAITITSKSQGDIQVKVKIEVTTKYLTRAEAKRYKDQITDDIHEALTNHYHVSQLTVK